MPLIDTLIAEIEQAQASARLLKAQQAPTWHSAFEVPENGLYIICTHKGAIYFAQPLGGCWDKNIRYWMPIPALPEDLKK